MLMSKLPAVMWFRRRHQGARRNKVATEASATRTELRRNYFGLWYRKTANATRTTVIIHRIMFLLLLFSSAMVKSTAQTQVVDQVPREILRRLLFQGFAIGPAVRL
jgi:hypothetical protein